MSNTGNTQQIIDYGATANDGQGDPLRTAFIKTDENFDNIWLAGPVGSNITIVNNTIQNDSTNGNIIIKPNGIGIVQSNAHMIPNMTNTRNLGSADLRWRTLYVGIGGIDSTGGITAGNIDVTGDLTVGGNLVVEGDTIEMGNITTDSLTIQLANTAGNAAQANGAGVTVGANDDIATLLYDSGNNRWTTNIGLSVGGPITGTSIAVSGATVYGNLDAVNGNFTGNVTANYFIGDGSLLTNINAANIDLSNLTGNINTTGNISANYFTGDGSLLTNIDANNINGLANVAYTGDYNDLINTPDFANLTVDIFTTGNITGNYIIGNGSQLIDVDAHTLEGAAADYSAIPDTIVLRDPNGNITGNYFIGDGSELTNIDANNINGLANVAYTGDYNDLVNTPDLGNLTGDISTTGNITANYFTGNGSLLTGITSYANANAAAYGEAGWAGNIIPASNNYYTLGNSTNQWESLYVSNTTIYINNVPISLTSSNVLTIDGEPILSNDSDTSITTTGNISANYVLGNGSQLTGLNTNRILNGNSNVEIATANGNVTVTANGIQTWTFDSDGVLTLPGNIAAGSNWINNLSDPANPQDAATKNYVDTVAQGLHIHSSCNVATTQDLATYTGATVTYNNGTGGVGATLTFSGNTLIAIDGVSLASQDRILVKDEANAVFNGIYVYSNATALTRATDFDSDIEGLGGDFVFVTSGNVNADTGWVQTTDAPSIGNSNIVWQQFSAAGAYTANTAAGLVLVGSVFNAQVDNVTTAFDLNGNIVVKASAALTTPNIGSATGSSLSVTGNITAGNIIGNFVAPASNTQVLFNDSNTINGSSAFTFDKNGNTLTIGTTGGTLKVADIQTPQAGVSLRLIPATGITYSYGHLYPLFANTYDTGGASNRWQTVYANVANLSTAAVSGAITANTITLSGTGTAVNASSGNMLTNQVTGTQFNFLSGLYTVSLNASGAGANYTLNLPANAGTNGQVLTTDGSGVLTWSTPASTYGNANVATFLASYGSNTISTSGNITGGYILGNGSQLTGVASLSFSTVSANGTSLVADSAADTLTVTPGNNMVITGTAGNDTVTFAVSESPTFSGTVTAQSFSGNISVTGNVTGTSANVDIIAGSYQWTFDNTGNLVLSGNTFAVNYANGTAVSLGGSTYGNANVVANLAALSSNPISTTGNVTASYFFGNISQTTGGYGNANVVANLAALSSNPVSTTGNVTAGNITITGNTTTGINAVTVGVNNVILPNTIASFSSNVNNYTQLTLENTNNGADATADFILTADNGNDTVNYGDFGIINSGYDPNTPTNSLGNIVYAADTYIYAQGNTSNTAQAGGNLVIGVTTASKNIKLFAGGANTSALIATVSNAGITMNSGNITGNTAGFAIGYRDIPQVSFAANATISTSDAGKHYYSTSASNLVLTIANNASQAFSIGAAINIINRGTGTMTIAQGSGVTLYLAGNTTAGNRTLSSYGAATIQKVESDVWFVVGTGLT